MPLPPSSAAAGPDRPPSPHPVGSVSSEAAERRLREAEERLREAIEELQRHHHASRDDSFGDGKPCCDHADESCIAHAIGNLCQSFLLSYGVRVGIGILLRAFKLARRQSYSSILDLKVISSLLSLIILLSEFFVILVDGEHSVLVILPKRDKL